MAPGLVNAVAELAGLVIESPQRGADRHGGQLAAGVLVRPRHAGQAAIFLGQARIDHAAEIHVAGRTAGGDDHRFARADGEPASPLCSTAMPSTRPACGACRYSATIRCSQQDLHAGSAGRGLPAGASARCPRTWSPAPPDRPACRSAPSASASRRRASRAAPSCRPRCRPGVRRLVDEDHAMRDQPLIGGGAVVGEGADDLAIVVAVVGKAVGFDHRPIGEVAEQQVGRVLDPVLLLRAGAAAQRNVAAAGDRVAADVAAPPRPR